MMLYHDREDDVARFGLTVDEIAAATAAMPIVDREKGTVTWLCRDCINRARQRPRWYSVQERLPRLDGDQSDKRVLVRLGPKGADGGIVASGRYDQKTGFQHHGCLPQHESEKWTVTHWAELPAGPYDVDDVFGINPEEHAKALFAASNITLSPHEWTWTQEEQEAMAKFVQWGACLLPLPKRPMRCGACGGTRIRTTEDVGSDIDPSGEESQHLDSCLDCGSDRLWGRRLHNFATPTVWWGEWCRKGEAR